MNFEKVFFCTGARNHDLLKEFSPESLIFEYDERMASFKALGFARITSTPVAICCTSGTAVAECVPALLEAFYSKIPLVLISGDRPKKMHGTGAPQTIHHAHLTQKIVGTYLELSLAEFKSVSLENVAYPVHINVLIDDSKPHDKTPLLNRSLKDFAAFMEGKKNPLFLFSHEEKSMRPFVEKFSETGLDFYAETMSGARDLSRLGSERALLKGLKEGLFDSVVRVGFTPLSKVWRLLELNHLPVFSFDSRNLPGLSHGEVAPLSSQELCLELQWWQLLATLESTKTETLDLEPLLLKYPQSEMSVLRALQDQLPTGALVYLGNSLVIRFFELVQKKHFRIHGSRGVNGIDGQLATAIGLALGTTEAVYCVLGDITALYDLSSFREIPRNLKLIVINNSGGRIFDLLGLDQRIVLEHDHDFKTISLGFGLRYAQNDLTKLENVDVLELRPLKPQTESFLKDWNA